MNWPEVNISTGPAEGPGLNGAQPAGDEDGVRRQKPGHGHGRAPWVMMLVCVPMIIVAVALAVSGSALAALVIALACAGLMAAMMLAAMRG